MSADRHQIAIRPTDGPEDEYLHPTQCAQCRVALWASAGVIATPVEIICWPCADIDETEMDELLATSIHTTGTANCPRCGTSHPPFLDCPDGFDG